jgi:hypothetical protein
MRLIGIMAVCAAVAGGAQFASASSYSGLPTASQPDLQIAGGDYTLKNVEHTFKLAQGPGPGPGGPGPGPGPGPGGPGPGPGPLGPLFHPPHPPHLLPPGPDPYCARLLRKCNNGSRRACRRFDRECD